jgi:hypothetical protein
MEALTGGTWPCSQPGAWPARSWRSAASAGIHDPNKDARWVDDLVLIAGRARPAWLLITGVGLAAWVRQREHEQAGRHHPGPVTIYGDRALMWLIHFRARCCRYGAWLVGTLRMRLAGCVARRGNWVGLLVGFGQGPMLMEGTAAAPGT